MTIFGVRRLSDYELSGRRIPGAIRIRLDEIPNRIAEIPKGPPILLYCA